MKKLSNSLLLMILTSAFLTFSCGDDEAPKKQFTVEGEAYALAKGHSALLGEGEDDDGNDIYGHIVVLTSEGLNMSEGGGIQFEGSGDLILFLLIGSEDDISEGTYEFGDEEKAGIFGEFIVYTGYTRTEGVAQYDRVFVATEGTIKVSKSGGKHTFKINITKFETEDEEGDEVTGEGSIKGYFRGELDDITPDNTPARKLNNIKSPFAETFNF